MTIGLLLSCSYILLGIETWNGICLYLLILLILLKLLIMLSFNSFRIVLVHKFLQVIQYIVTRMVKRKLLSLLVDLSFCKLKFLIICMIMIFNAFLFLIYKITLGITFSLQSIHPFHIYVQCFTISSYKSANSRALLWWLIFLVIKVMSLEIQNKL